VVHAFRLPRVEATELMITLSPEWPLRVAHGYTHESPAPLTG
jgi:hypothetical protein